MAYACPRCNDPVHRAHSASAQFAGGLVGAMLHAAFADFVCARCGTLRKDEFSAEARMQMAQGTAGLVVGAIALGTVCVWLLGA